MELKLGYKQTDVGVLPEDWSMSPVGEVCGFIVPGRNKPRQFDGEIPWVTTPDLEDGRSVGSSRIGLCVSKEEARAIGSRVVPAGSVLMSCAGDLGITAITRNEMVINQQLHAFIPSPLVNAVYLLNVLASQKGQIGGLATKTAVPYLNKNNCNSIRIPLPPITEQEAIAEALSDADALIESQEHLIAKKRQVKQGAMQELLTGKKRLPGFNSEWAEKRLDELGHWKGGMTPSMQNPDYWWAGTVPWVSSGDVKSVRLITTASAVSEYAIKKRTTTLLPANSIILVTRSGILRKFLPVAMNMIPMAINQDIKALLPTGDAMPEYLLHSLSYNGDRILARCLKSGTTVESIEFPWLKAFTIPLPPIPEQTAIASVLSDMDTEITSLEAKIAKARQIKQGMMQELLTGRIRLV